MKVIVNIYVYDTYNNEWLCNTPMMNPYEYDFLKKILEQELGMSEEELKYEQTRGDGGIENDKKRRSED